MFYLHKFPKFVSFIVQTVHLQAINTVLTDPGFAVTDPDLDDSYTCTMDCGSVQG